MSDKFMMRACAHCPFRKDVKPFLHPERAEEIAYNASSRYGSFPCHKTTVPDDDSGSGEMLVTEESKECAGHLTMQFYENDRTFYDDDGFKPDDRCYESPYEMIDAYTEEWEEQRKAIKSKSAQ